MFTELTILRAVQHGVVWKRENFNHFEQVVALCRQLRDAGYFSLDETPSSDAAVPKAIKICDFTQAGMARLNVLRKE